MQMVKKILIGILVVWLGIIIFMPKKDIYFKLEETLAQRDIKLNEETIEDNLFSLNIKNISVYFKGMNVAFIDEINIFTLLFVTKVDIDSIEARAILTQSIKSLNISHSILSPVIFNIDINSSIGEAGGYANIQDRILHLDLNMTKEVAMLKPLLKKDENGWYYETAF